MADYWYAECLPCKWQERYTVEDAAIAAAEDHVAALHRNVPPLERARKVIGHVQLRGENTVGASAPPFPIEPVPLSPSGGQDPQPAEGPLVTDPELGV